MTTSISTLALATIAELERRGWSQGELAETQPIIGLDDDGYELYGDVSEAECKVCLVGGMSSAYNPFHPRVPGYNFSINAYMWDEETKTGTTVVQRASDADYQRFVDAVAAELPAESDYRGDVINRITMWNDHDDRTFDEVKALLTRVAVKHSAVSA